MYGVIPLGTEPEAMPIDYRADFPFALENPCPPAGEDDPHAWQRNARLLHQGITFVANEGDAAYNVLVLRGPAAGQIWWLNYEYAAAIPVFDPDTRTPLSFLDWYELWLSRASDPDREQVSSFADVR